MSKNKDGYLYMRLYKELYGINISKLLREQKKMPESYIKESLEKIEISEHKFPEMELILDFESHDCPLGMGFVTMGSKVYLVGGEKEGCANFDVFSFDPEGPSIRPCPNEIPRFLGPKTKPLVVTLENKIYVMSKELSGYLPDLQKPIFEVLDSDSGAWRSLSDPPFFSDAASQHPGCHIISAYFVWGHNLVVCMDWDTYYIFDAREEKWVNRKDIPDPMPRLPWTAQFENFIIGMPRGSKILASYRLDSNGLPIPKSGQKLEGPEQIFSFYDIERSKGFVFHLGGSRMCFVCPVLDGSPCWRVRVVVFRVFTSCLDDEREPILTAILEAAQFYDVEKLKSVPPAFYPAIVMCGGEHDLEADARLANSNISRSNRFRVARGWLQNSTKTIALAACTTVAMAAIAWKLKTV